MSNEIVIKHVGVTVRGWLCPRCWGQGYLNDGSVCISETETRITPPTKCFLCRGKGRVVVSSIPDEESP